MGKQGAEGFEQEEVGGECRSLEVLHLVAGQGSEEGEEGEKVQPRATAGPQLKLPGRKQ